MGREIWGELGVWLREWDCTLDLLLGTCVCLLGFLEAAALLEELPS